MTPECKAIIATVGLQSGVLGYMLRQLKPYYAVFFCTLESSSTLDSLLQEYGELPPSRFLKKDIKDSPNEIGNLVREVYSSFGWLTQERGIAESAIYVDPTAGRKWMSAGLTMIASHLNLHMVYVHAQYRNGDLVPGTESLVSLGNAYTQIGFLEAALARDHFNSFNYGLAADIFGKLKGSVAHSADAELYEALAHLAKTLHRWDLFEHYYGKDGGEKNPLRKDFTAAHDKLERALRSSSVSTDALREFLEKSRRLCESIHKVATDPKPSLAAVCDLLQNARRRLHRGRYDDAMARCYRALEALGQYRLSLKNLQASSFSLKNLKPEEQTQLRKLYQPDGPQEKLGCRDIWVVLYVLGDCVAADVAVSSPKPDLKGKFRDMLDYRNQSILAHGWNRVDYKSANEMLQLVEGLLTKSSHNSAGLLTQLTIPQLPPLWRSA